MQPDGTYVAYVESGTNPIVKAMASDSRATTTLKTNGAAVCFGSWLGNVKCTYCINCNGKC